MSDQTLEFEAREYVYDLENCSKEHGFKAEEGWELALATTTERITVEKKYFPTISAKVAPGALLELLRLVKHKLGKIKYGLGKMLEHDNSTDNQLQYLIALNPYRLQR
jgi:hypothetical protein